jgi:hypothetical protein
MLLLELFLMRAAEFTLPRSQRTSERARKAAGVLFIVLSPSAATCMFSHNLAVDNRVGRDRSSFLSRGAHHLLLQQTLSFWRVDPRYERPLRVQIHVNSE